MGSALLASSGPSIWLPDRKGRRITSNAVPCRPDEFQEESNRPRHRKIQIGDIARREAIVAELGRGQLGHSRGGQRLNALQLGRI